MARNDAATGKKRVNKQEEAVKALEQLVQVPLRDVNELMDHVDKGDIKGAMEAAKRIRERINKYGF